MTVTGKKFLEWKYGIVEVPDDVKPMTLEQVKKQDELIKKAKAGQPVEKTRAVPARTEAVRTFNAFVDDQYFSVEVDLIGGAPSIRGPVAAQLAPHPPSHQGQG